MPKLQLWDMRNPHKYGFDPNNYGWIVPLVGIVDQTSNQEEPEAEEEPPPMTESSKPEPTEPSKPEPSKPEPNKPSKPAAPPPMKPAAPPPMKPAAPPPMKPAAPPPSKPPMPLPSKPPMPLPKRPPMPLPSPDVVKAEEKLKKAKEAEADAKKEADEAERIAAENKKRIETHQAEWKARQLNYQKEREAAKAAAEKKVKENQIIEEERRRNLTRRMNEIKAQLAAANATDMLALQAKKKAEEDKEAEAKRAIQLEISQAAEDAKNEEARLIEIANKAKQEAAVIAQREEEELIAAEKEAKETAAREAAALEVVRVLEEKLKEAQAAQVLRDAQVLRETQAAEEAENARIIDEAKIRADLAAQVVRDAKKKEKEDAEALQVAADAKALEALKKKEQEDAIAVQEAEAAEARANQELQAAQAQEQALRDQALRDQALRDQALRDKEAQEAAEKARIANVHGSNAPDLPPIEGPVKEKAKAINRIDYLAQKINKQKRALEEDPNQPELREREANWGPAVKKEIPKKVPPAVAPKPTAASQLLTEAGIKRANEINKANNRNNKIIGKEYPAQPNVKPPKPKPIGGTRRIKHKETRNNKVYRKRTKRRLPKYTRKLAYIRLPHVSLPCIS